MGLAIFHSLIVFLIIVCLVAGAIWLVFFVFNKVAGQPIPPKVQMIVWLVFMLICLLLLVERLWPIIGHYTR